MSDNLNTPTGLAKLAALAETNARVEETTTPSSVEDIAALAMASAPKASKRSTDLKLLAKDAIKAVVSEYDDAPETDPIENHLDSNLFDPSTADRVNGIIADIVEDIPNLDWFAAADQAAQTYEEIPNVDDPKYDVIDKLIAYEPEYRRLFMSEHYAPMTLEELQAVLENMTREFGPADALEIDEQIEDLIQNAKNDPEREALLKRYEEGRVQQTKILTQLHSMLGSQVDMNKLLQPEYHESGRKAVEENFMLKRAIGEFLSTTKLTNKTDLSSLNGILTGLKFLFAHYRTNNEKVDRFVKLLRTAESEVERSERYTQEARDMLSRERADFGQRLRAIQDSMIPLDSKVLIGRKNHGQFLADKNYARRVAEAKEQGEGHKKIKHNPAGLLYTDLIWVADPDCAMKFDTPERALRMLESILEVVYREVKAQDVMVAGAALDEISIVAPMMVHLSSDLSLS